MLKGCTGSKSEGKDVECTDDQGAGEVEEKCISPSEVCDGREDSMDGRDETSCGAPASEPVEDSTPGGKILVVMTNHSAFPTISETTGLWLTELTHFYDIAQAAGYEMDFVSPLGGNVPLDERSLKSIYLDKSAKAHLADPEFMQRLKSTQPPSAFEASTYKAVYYTGGHGTMWDFRDNKELKNISEKIYRQGNIVSAVCHGVAGLIPLQDENGKALIAGRTVTGFSNIEEKLSGMKSQVPFLLQDDLVARGAKYKSSLIPFTSYVISDDRIITGQNPQSSKEVGEAVVKRLRALD